VPLTHPPLERRRSETPIEGHGADTTALFRQQSQHLESSHAPSEGPSKRPLKRRVPSSRTSVDPISDVALVASGGPDAQEGDPDKEASVEPESKPKRVSSFLKHESSDADTAEPTRP
jgi:hypothetical protein